MDLVPELKLIIGEQPPGPGTSATGRARPIPGWYSGDLLEYSPGPEHPLALFLDDLQWLEAATLDLMEDLLTRSDVRHLMLIGAYRDNEVNPSHSTDAQAGSDPSGWGDRARDCTCPTRP